MLIAFIVLYILLTLGLGLGIARRVKSSKDFVLAGRNLPLALNTFALFALWYGSETVFGASSEFIRNGFPGVIQDPIGASLCLILYGLFLARPLYKMNLLTLGDLFREKYGVKVELISSIFMIPTFIGYIAAQLVALGILLQIVIGISFFQGILFSALVVTLYTTAGGMWAISVTDFMQSVVIIVGLLWVCVTLGSQAGGFQYVIEQAPPEFFDWKPPQNSIGLLEWLSALMVVSLGSMPSQDIFQRVNAARSPRAAQLAGVLGGSMYLVFGMLPLYLALVIRVIEPGWATSTTQELLPKIIFERTALPAQVMLFGALISAIFSTCSGAILAPASILSENIVKPLLKNQPSESLFLLILRCAVVLMALLAVLMAVVRSNIYQLVAESSMLGLVSLLVPMLCAIFLKSYSRLGALLAMFLGMAAYLMAEYLLPTAVPSLFYGLGVSSLGMLIGYAFKR